MKLHISPQAQSDLRGIKEYIAVELENPAAALNTVSKLTKAIRRLSDFPGSGAPLSSVMDVQNNYRFLVSGSYLVFYRYEGDSVYVVRVLYGRRDYIKILFGEPQADEN
ncbi:type II toxin-antitoxin system RelE/ParE family toxin [Desulforamulus ruminis]|uniref:Addiction module toxin, RelE/StbE family n=1 Tax=Desulforamulus ruminis (strain ATCC 23193 / DSM 2154 / NCIMB 8452 / DL) TaxID=696281 RepID=F6DL52_DESRL|nr:type II toxin-antitoxin system RelE/ParE family toxin [Desulforamulus ruminis]AEG59273.1 addiction module toxin, RelE/StbE family [Desulforamulus ruminis DSM 2154]